MLKQEYKEEGMNLEEALKMAIKVLSKTLDVQKLSIDKGITFCTYLFQTSVIVQKLSFSSTGKNQDMTNTFVLTVLFGDRQGTLKTFPRFN